MVPAKSILLPGVGQSSLLSHHLKMRLLFVTAFGRLLSAAWQLGGVNTAPSSSAFCSWPPPFCRGAAERGEGLCCSIALHFLPWEESQVTSSLKKHVVWPVLRPPQGLGG